MAWQHYRLLFRLLSPLHIGYRQAGNLMQARRYVPGKVLWAALTARITRDEHDGHQGHVYQRIGDLLHKHFRFGYLWLSLDKEHPYFPWDDDFDYLFLNSYAATALDYGRTAALDGSLRETEFLAPVTRDKRKVYLIGDMWVVESLPPDLTNWKKALRKMQLGGERGYGWGRIRLDGEIRPSEMTKIVGGFDWRAADDEVVVTLSTNEHITAHAVAAGQRAITGVSGAVEPLVGWERQSSGKYELSKDVIVAYTPGSIVNEEIEVCVGKWGIMETQ